MDSLVPFPADSSPALSGSHRRVSPSEVLDLLEERIARTLADGGRPLVVYDLDATLFDNRPRVLRILRDLAEEDSTLDERTRALVKSITLDRIRYRVADTLRAAGLTDPALLERFQEGWWKRFFTNEYVVFDLPTPGSVEFVRRVAEFGGTTIYLTGRDTPGMSRGTLSSLIKHGFPVPDDRGTILITKPTFEQPDMEYKREAVARLREIGRPVGLFDNEPKPLNVLVRGFPEALAVFLDTMHSPDVEPLEPGVLVMGSFVADTSRN